MKVMKSLDNKEILLKGTTRKILNDKSSQTINDSQFTINEKCIHTPLAKSVLLPLGLSGMSAAHAFM